MEAIYHENDSRGVADHGWLVSRHTFSFANYYNEARMNFGSLRVLNDDIVKPAKGFGTHPHENMEIVSIPLSGSLRHQDSMGNIHTITAGEVQVMSAGTGLTHSEYNNSTSEDVNFLQIWILPGKRDIAPRYGQKFFDEADRKNRFQLLVSPRVSNETVWINQNAWLSLVDVQSGEKVTYEKYQRDTGVYYFVIEGNASIDGHGVRRRDGLGLLQKEAHSIQTLDSLRLLAVEVPMTGML